MLAGWVLVSTRNLIVAWLLLLVVVTGVVITAMQQ